MRLKLHIQGVSSWIGSYLISYIAKNNIDIKLTGTYRSNDFDIQNSDYQFIKIDKNFDAMDFITKQSPDFIINLARGESDEDFEFHQKIVQWSKNFGSHYGYASSANVRDAAVESDHNESDLPKPSSEYGKFKARCENYLNDINCSYSVFRFSATHGFAPNRISRTEEFLKKISINKTVEVPRGVIQNRTYVGDLAGMIVDTLLERSFGVHNLGAIDSSEEYSFLRKLASTFGYDPMLIQCTNENECNFNLIPQKIYSLFGNKWKKTEDDAIKSIFMTKSLSRYRK